jgi:hypothetical protein
VGGGDVYLAGRECRASALGGMATLWVNGAVQSLGAGTFDTKLQSKGFMWASNCRDVAVSGGRIHFARSSPAENQLAFF